MVQKSRRKNRYKTQAAAAKTARPIRWWLSGALWGAAGVAIIAAMSLVCIFSYDWVTQCAYFRADEIKVTGCNRLDPERIKALSGAREGVNILSVNLAAAGRRLSAEPWIKDVNIRRVFPSKMTIDIQEQEALAIIDFGRSFLLNADGNIFKEYEGDAVSPLPVVTGVPYRDWTAGNIGEARVFDAVMKVLALGKNENSAMPNSNMEKIIVDKEIGLTLKMREPATFVALGFDGYEKKFERFATITAHLEQKEMEKAFSLVDLKNPDRIVARPVCENNVVAGKGGLREGT